jgi:hypothetical protein
MKKLATMLVLSLLIVGLIPIAEAKSLKERDQEWKTKFAKAWQEYNKVRDFYKDSRQKWITARNKIREFKSQNRSLTEAEKTEAIDKAQDFLLKAAQVMQSKLEAIKVWAENAPMDEDERTKAVNELTREIEDLNIVIAELEEANTAAELLEAQQKVRNRWNNVKPLYKKWVGTLLVQRFSFVLDRFDALSEVMHKKVATLDQDNAAYNDILALLEDYDQKLEFAHEYLVDAKKDFQSIKSVKEADQVFRNANQFMNKAHDYLVEAHKSAVELAKEYKANQEDDITRGFYDVEDEFIEVSGTGRLKAVGDGKAVIEAEIDFLRISGEGTLVVRDNAGDMTITVGGWGSKTQTGDNEWTYKGKGWVRITGSDVYVKLEGTGISLVGEGSGTAKLAGEGKYWKGRKQGEWPLEATLVATAITAGTIPA